MQTRLTLVTALFIMLAGNVAMAQRVQTGFLDRTVNVAGQDFRYQVYVPNNYADVERWPVIMFLHGSGERGSDGLIQTVVGLGNAIRLDPTRYPAIVVFPQVPRDSEWIGVPGEAAMSALEQTMNEFKADPDRVYLTGLSLGGRGTWYLAYRHPERFAAVVPICGWVSAGFSTTWPGGAVPAEDGEPFAALARRLGKLPVWIFHGEVDAAVSVEESRKAAAALESAGGDVRYTEFLGVGHNSWDATYASPEFSTWLFAQRRKS
jgi:predicted peptidase